MTSAIKNYDWKAAAAAKGTIPNKAAEEAFYSSAYGFVVNRAGVLMQDPYRLGFEVVWKNNDNTKMVGIFAFRIDDELLYCPVFFTEGGVKGYDLLQRTKSKTFVPFTEEWVSYLVENRMPHLGRGIDHSLSRSTPNSLELIRLAYPPFNRKYARHDEPDLNMAEVARLRANKAKGWDKLKPLFVVKREDVSDEEYEAARKSLESRKAKKTEDKEASNAEWEAALDEMGKQATLEPVLGKFIQEDGGQDAMQKIASLIERSPKFAELIHFETNMDEWCRDDVPDFHKKASAPATPLLTLYTGMQPDFLKSASAEQREELLKKGYYLKDERPEEALSVTYAYEGKEIEKIGRPGIYEVLGEHGTTTEAFVAKVYFPPRLFAKAPRAEAADFSDFYRSVTPTSNVLTAERTDPDWNNCMTIVTKDGAAALGTDQAYGYYRAYDLPQVAVKDEFKSYFKEEMEKGKAYLIYNMMDDCVLPKPFYCFNKKTKNGITCYGVVQTDDGYSNGIDLRSNPDVKESDYEYGSLGSAVRFIPVDIEAKQEPKAGEPGQAAAIAVKTKEFCPATPDQFEAFIQSTDFNAEAPIKIAKISLWKSANDGMFYLQHRNNCSNPMGRASAAVALSRDLQMSAEDTEEILNKAAATETTFFLETKNASVIRVVNEPHFQTDYDNDFGVPLEYPQEFALNTTADYMRPPAPHIGDGWDPTLGNNNGNEDRENGAIPKEMLLKASPEEIASFAQQGEIPGLFEHGVVGSLIDTYDSMAMIDKYQPMLEKAVDALGRSYFLLCWKPQDFEKAYGVDDMTNIENKVLSNFRSLGDLTLDLLKRSQKSKGSVNAISS